MKPGWEPKGCKLYPLTEYKEEKLYKMIQEHLKRGTIWVSKSPQAFLFFFVNKKEGDLWPVQDYRRLNEWTIKNKYPLPLIDNVIRTIAKLKAKIFSKFNVKWGYNNIRVTEGDKWKTAFLTKYGLYECLVMFFGLCNSPATFQTMMNTIFHDLIVAQVMTVYMDDILLFMKTIEEHWRVTIQIMQILQDNNLFLKPMKCHFKVNTVEYLRFIISTDQISMDPVKIEGISAWPTVRTVS